MAKQINNPYPINDLNKMLLLFKAINLNEQQQQDLWFFIKKYIEPNHPKPISGCNCSLSYGSCMIKLREWVSINANKFK